MDWDDDWPEFLDRLDSDPRLASLEFHQYAKQLVDKSPPTGLRQWIAGGWGQNPLEFVSELHLHCTDRNFARLRQYRRQQGGGFKSWLLEVARNRIINDLRKHRPEYQKEPTPTTGRRSLPPSLKSAVQECLATLSTHQQELLRLHDVEGLPPRKIAEELGLPGDEETRKKISGQIRRARELLEGCVKTKQPHCHTWYVLHRGKYRHLVTLFFPPRGRPPRGS